MESSQHPEKRAGIEVLDMEVFQDRVPVIPVDEFVIENGKVKQQYGQDEKDGVNPKKRGGLCGGGRRSLVAGYDGYWIRRRNRGEHPVGGDLGDWFRGNGRVLGNEVFPFLFRQMPRP